jgi:hypothetical protein
MVGGWGSRCSPQPTRTHPHCIPPPNPRRSNHFEPPPPAHVLNLFDILGPSARDPAITAAVSVLAGNDEAERGSVFTRPDVVAAILDLSGYVNPCRAEPACAKLRPCPETSNGFRHPDRGKRWNRHDDACAASTLNRPALGKLPPRAADHEVLGVFLPINWAAPWRMDAITLIRNQQRVPR